MNPVLFRLEEESQVGYARRRLLNMVREAGFGETKAQTAALVVTEIAGNVVRHGCHGHLFLRILQAEESRGIEILAVDCGPGFSRPAEVFADGFSTGGGPGMGLGAIRRLSDESDAHSFPGKGVVIMSRIWAGNVPESLFDVGGIAVPFDGESSCGDSWCAHEFSSSGVFCLADGLGHGPKASEASMAAVEVVSLEKGQPPSKILGAIQTGIRHTRGAVALVARIDPSEGRLRYAGMGNIDARTIGSDGRQHHLLSRQGALGTVLHTGRNLHEEERSWNGDEVLFMASDGLKTRWSPDDFPGLFRRHPSVIAGVLWRELSRETDDVSLLICRRRQV